MRPASGPLASSLFDAPGRPQALRAFLLFALVFALQIPTLFMNFLVSERRSRHNEAATEIAAKWGKRQAITGPALVVPWTRRWRETDDKGHARDLTEERRLVILPESLDVDAHLRSEVRRRGIYPVPVYRLQADLRGRFAPPDFAKLGIAPADVDWKRAVLAVGIADARAIQEQVALDWNGRVIEFLPGNADAPELGGGIHAELDLKEAPWAQPFTVPLRLNGSDGAYFTPFGKQTRVRLAGDWRNPSFQGAWLPTERSVTKTAFTATWSIPSLGRNYPQAWTEAGELNKAISASEFGLDLDSDLDAYRLCERTLKYALLFFVLTFTAFWLLEVLGGRPLHPIHYLLIGAALSLFLVLELALSEHVGFGASYAIASAAVVGLIVFYASAVLGSRVRAAGVGLGLALLYGFHYVVLRNEDYALLLGSLLLFVTLAAVMVLTRRVNWYGATLDGAPAAPDGR
jgi:inner membrane protein